MSPEEEKGFENKNFQIRVTPYYAKLAQDEAPGGPIRKILMPHASESAEAYQEMLDPLGERKKKNRPVDRIIHRYADRCLLLITDFCSVYCRYCTRKHFTGRESFLASPKEYEDALAYIKNTPSIREVILSGGDPLTLSDAKLEKVLSDLREIEHVELIRIGTRIPVVNPMRVTEDLAVMLRRYKPVYIMSHFNHPKELTLEAAEALERFVDHGHPVFNQMVLLNGVNNHPAVIYALSRRLLYLRVKPYYMHQCDPSIGTDHLRTHFGQSRELQEALWGRASGLAMPGLSLDIPDGGGKAGFAPPFVKSESDQKIVLKGFDGLESEYINPPRELMHPPMDYKNYLKEWESVDSFGREPISSDF